MEPRPIGPSQVQFLVVPAVVCGVFSIELGLKALLLRAGAEPTGHNLVKLFAQLEQSLQAAIVSSVALPDAAFHKELTSLANTFIEWRYIYERDHAHVNNQFVASLAGAVQAAL